MSKGQAKAGKIGNSLVFVGRYTYGFENISIKQWGEGATLKIGSFCSIAGNIRVFLGGNHRTNWITTYPFGHVFADELGGQHIVGHPSTKGDVDIGDDVWIGEAVTIMSGVTIGNGSVLAANSTVTKDVAPYQVVGGNPARLIKERFDDELIALLNELRWWDLDVSQIKEITEVLSSPPTADVLRRLLAQYR